MNLQTIISWILPPGALLTLATLGARAWWRSHKGKLTRAELLNSRAKNAEKQAARYLAYVWKLQAMWPSGHPMPPWPRGLKPKE